MAIITFHCFCLRNRTQIVDSFKLLVLILYMMPWTMVVKFGISASCLFDISHFRKIGRTLLGTIHLSGQLVPSVLEWVGLSQEKFDDFS